MNHDPQNLVKMQWQKRIECWGEIGKYFFILIFKYTYTVKRYGFKHTEKWYICSGQYVLELVVVTMLLPQYTLLIDDGTVK